MTYRITTNGSTFRIQRSFLCISWSTLREYCGNYSFGFIDWESKFATFESREAAFLWIQEHKGCDAHIREREYLP